MVEFVEFPEFVTKGITIRKGSDRRIFKGHITAEIIDKQQEFIFVKNVMAIMKTFMSVNPVISDYHSNRMVGKVLDYEKSSYQGVPTVLITAEVYKKEGVTLYDKIWAKVVSGEYAGLSMGGASREREPIVKDGRMALELRKLELYEIALCDSPANPFAIIESVNTFAKAQGLEHMVKEINGREQIRCTSISCRFEKGTNIDRDKDIDNNNNTLEQFDKPTQTLKEGDSKDNDMEKHHQVGLTEEQEYDPKREKKIEETKKTEVEPNDQHISPDTELPCVAADNEEQAKAKKDGEIMHIAKQTVPHKTQTGVENEASKEDLESVRNKDGIYKNDIHSVIKYFGTEIVREALVEIDTINHLKAILAKYQ